MSPPVIAVVQRVIYYDSVVEAYIQTTGSIIELFYSLGG